MAELEPDSVWKALFKGAVTFIGGAAVIGGGLTGGYNFFVKPNLNDLIQESVERAIKPPFIEFSGGRGVVQDHDRVYRPGEVVTIEYLVRRHSPCPTDVVVQFYSLNFGRILTQYTYEIAATQARPSFEPILFSVDVRLPDNMQGGTYRYEPLLRPDRSLCPGESDIRPPPSNYFEVSRD